MLKVFSSPQNLQKKSPFLLDDNSILVVKATTIKKENIEQMVQKGFEEIGGISKYIKKGQTVVIKPNIGFNSKPEQAHTTNPDLVEAIAKLCIKAGAKVKIFDRSAYSAKLSYKSSGILDAGKNAGATVSYIDERKFKKIPVKKGLNLSTLEVYEDILKADFVINVPIAKHHGSAKLTLSMKNLMGVIGKNRGLYHLSLHKNIVDFTKTVPVNLAILDATRILTDNGPASGTLEDVKTTKTIMFAKNQITLDAYATKTLFNIEPKDIDYIKYAYQEKMGEININKMNIKTLEVLEVKTKFDNLKE